MKKRFLSGLLALTMMLTLLPTAAFATPESSAEPTSVSVVDSVRGAVVSPTEGTTSAPNALYGGFNEEELDLMQAEPADLSLVDQLKQRELLAAYDEAQGIAMLALGDESDPFVISNAAQLAELATLVNDGNADFTDANYELAEDIDLSTVCGPALNGGTNWTPIGRAGSNYDDPFRGTFDGKGHTISNLYINNGSMRQGLFGYVSDGATIQNVGVVDADITGGSYIGGVVGIAADGATITIQNCYTTGTVSGEKVGGVVGYAMGLTLQNCYSTATIHGGSNAGGVAGWAESGTLRNCYSTGPVAGSDYVGGVVGNATCLTLQNCYSTGTVTGGRNYVGGVVGYDGGFIVENCVALNQSVSGSPDATVGAVAGAVARTDPVVIIRNSAYWQGMSVKKGDTEVADDEKGTNSIADRYNVITTVISTALTYSTDTGLSTQLSEIFENDSAWTYTENGLPTLKNVGGSQSSTLPLYITNPADENTLYISSAIELLDFANHVNGTGSYADNADNFAGKTVYLTADIDLSTVCGASLNGVETSWTPIGTYNSQNDNKPFSGTFDGQGHTVSNLYINTTSDYQGLFGYAQWYFDTGNSKRFSFTIQNVGVVNANITGGEDTGGVVGYIDGAFPNTANTVQNCYSTGTVTGTALVGGVVGYIYGYSASRVNTIVQSCYSTVTVTGTGSVGGVGGYCHFATVQNCYSTGRVTATNDDFCAGGVVGLMGNGSTMNYCYSTGTVTGKAYVGGVATMTGSGGVTLTNSVALNSSVSGTLADAVVAVDGHSTFSCPTCYYWANLTAGNGHSANALTCENGALSEQLSEIFGADNTAWTFTENGLPILKNAGGTQSSVLPKHLMDNDTTVALYTAADLLDFANQVNGTGDYTTDGASDFAGKTVLLMNDIDLSGVSNWTPIGGWYDYNATPFSGIFDGQGHTISGLSYNGRGNSIYGTGLFGYVSGGTVQNVGVVKVNITHQNYSPKLGAVVGWADNATIQNCYSTGIISTNGTELAILGGVVGYAGSGTTVQNCYSTATVKTDDSSGSAGGVVGTMEGKTLKNCVALNTSISCGEGAAVGAVVGSAGSTNGNAYWVGMSVKKGGIEQTTKDATSANALIQKAGMLYNGTTAFDWTGFDTSIWTIPTDALVLPYFTGSTDRPTMTLLSTQALALDIDYVSENLIGARGGKTYSVKVGDAATTSDYTAEADGTIAIDETWFGSSLTVTCGSESQTITIPARPAAPTGIAGVNETFAGESDGKITGLTAGKVYQLSTDGLDWTDKTATEVGEITGLTGLALNHTYKLRVKGAGGVFASKTAEVAIAAGAARTYTLNVTSPAFTEVYGYAQPAAKAITIESTGNSNATIASVVVSGSDFTIGGSGASVTAGGSITTWTIRPVTGLDKGTYNATITVTYNGGATTTANVNFTVNPAPPTAPILPALSAVNYSPTGKLSDTTLTGGWVWESPDTVPTVGNSGYAVYYAVTDYTNYDWSKIPYYNATTHRVERMVSLTVNPAAVTITPTTVESRLTQTYAGESFDVAQLQLFALDDNCGTAAYTLTSGDGNITPAGVLTVTRAGTFRIHVATAAEGNYAAGSADVTLTVNKGVGVGTVSMNGYTYNGTISKPGITDAIGTPTYYYNTTNSNTGGTAWNGITNVTLAANDYWMYAKVAESDLYNAYTTAAVKFTVAPAQVTALDLTNLVTKPTKNGTPQADFDAQAQYTGTISWNHGTSDFLGGREYAAVVTLTATDNYTLNGLKAKSFTYTGAAAVYDPDAHTVTITFPATENRAANKVEVIGGKLTKATYNIGETLDPAGLTVTVTYDDKTTQTFDTTTGFSGFTFTPATMAANTRSVKLKYGNVESEAVTVTVRENLVSITNPDAITNVVNGAANTPAALGLPETVGITTSTGVTATAKVEWTLTGTGYDPDSIKAKNFTVTGKAALPTGMSNVNGVALNATISVSVKAAEMLDTAVDATGVTGLVAGQKVTAGDKLTITASEVAAGDKTYIPILWATNPSGTFTRSTGATYTATVNTTGMSVANHTFTITYREVNTADRTATGKIADGSIGYRVIAKPTGDDGGSGDTGSTATPAVTTNTITTNAGVNHTITTNAGSDHTSSTNFAKAGSGVATAAPAPGDTPDAGSEESKPAETLQPQSGEQSVSSEQSASSEQPAPGESSSETATSETTGNTPAGGSPMPLVAGLVAVLAIAGITAAFVKRRRKRQ